VRPIFILLLLVLAFAVHKPVDAKPKPCKGCYCSVSATSVNFGDYDIITGYAVDSAGNVEVSCGTDTIGDTMSYAIELSGAKKGSKPRELGGPGSYELEYNLYTNVSRTIIWGDGKGSTATVDDSYVFPVLCCVTRNYTIYGRIDAGQNVVPAIYSDTVVVGVDF